MKNLLRRCNGHTPVFVSTYVFPTDDTMIVDKIVFDLDSKLSLSIPYKDVLKLRKFCKDKKIPYTTVFSGRKGFHFYIHTKPIYCQTLKEREYVKNLLYSIQLSLVNHLGIDSIDLPTIGRLRFLIRLPTSVYVNGKGPNGNYCRWIKDTQLQKGLKYVFKLAKEGSGEYPPAKDSKFTLEKLTELIPKYELRRKYSTTEYINGGKSIQGGKVKSAEGIGCPCLKQAYIESSPAHHVRVEITAWLKLIGYTNQSIIQLYKKSWKDFDFRKTKANVETIKPRLPKCTMLREIYGDDLCKKCPIGGRRRVENKNRYTRAT